MLSKIRFSIWFSIILLSAFLVGYLSWAKATFNWPFDDTFYPYPERPSELTANLTEGWQTYIYRFKDLNNLEGRDEFTIKYPPGWQAEGGYLVESGRSVYDGGGQIMLSVKKSLNSSLKKDLAEKKKASGYEVLKSFYSDDKFFTIDGENAVQTRLVKPKDPPVTPWNAGWAGGLVKTTIIYHEGKIYRIIGSAPNDRITEIEKIYDDALSSFKFSKIDSKSETAGWKTYKNNEIGIAFRYPPEFGTPQVTKYSKGTDTTVFGGKSILVSFPDVLHFEAATSDFQRFMGGYFTGKEPIESACENPLQFSDNGYVCKVEYINNNKFLIENRDYGAECSYFGFRIEGSANNKSNSEYKGLHFSMALKDISERLERAYDCWDESKVKQFDAATKAESENIINMDDSLSFRDLKSLDTFFKILRSLEFTSQ